MASPLVYKVYLRNGIYLSAHRYLSSALQSAHLHGDRITYNDRIIWRRETDLALGTDPETIDLLTTRYGLMRRRR